MLIQPPPLADQMAQLHTALRAEGTCAWLPEAVHALIAAFLARIFGRLEQLLQLWQSGNFPAPQPQRPADPAARPRPPCVRRAPASARSRHRTVASGPAAIAQPVAAPNPAPAIAPSGAIIPSPRPRSAHDPPAAQTVANTSNRHCGSTDSGPVLFLPDDFGLGKRPIQRRPHPRR